MRIEINRAITMESLELELFTVKEELAKVQEAYTDLAKQLKELRDRFCDMAS